MKIKLTLLTLSLGILSFAQAQRDSSARKSNSDFNSLRDHISVGGDFQLWYSTGGGIINLSPMGGYRWTKGFMTGIGLTYQHTSAIDYNNQKFVNDLFGWRVFARQDLFKFLFVNAEYENYYTTAYDWFINKDRKVTIPVGNVGLGFKRSMSENSYYQVLVQYDLIQDRFTRYYVYPLEPLSIKLGIVINLGDF